MRHAHLQNSLLGSFALMGLLACSGPVAPQSSTSSETSSPTEAEALPAIIGGVAGTVSAQYSDSPSGEGIANVMDGKTSTKYLTFHTSAWLQWKGSSATAMNSYAITSANDFASRDPKNFTLQGSANGTTWTTLNSQSNQSFSARFQKKAYTFSNSTAYLYYRLNITANNGDAYSTQLAEWDLTPAPPANTATVYEHCDFGGFAIPLAVGNYALADLNAKGIPNDQISSLKVTAGYQATLYQDDHFTGTAITVTGDDSCLVDNGFNDAVSSIIIAPISTPTVPAAPTSLTATANSATQITLGWVDQSTNESLFRIEQSTDGVNFTSKATTAANATSAAISGLAASTKYYYRVRAENTAGNSAYTNIASATTQSSTSGDWSSFVYPTVTFTDEATGLEGSTIFHAAIPNVTQMMKDQCLAICKEIYTDNNDRRNNFTKLNLILQNDPTGVAAKWGDAPEIWIGVSAQYLATFYHNNGSSNDLVLREVRGILSHEGTHGYQWAPKNCGTYDGSSTFWGFIEGEADGVRGELTNWTPTRYPSKGGNWNGGYTTGGFFLDWCKHNKKATFLIELNHAARDMGTFTWDAAFQQILGQPVQTVWNEYQATLK